MADLTAKINAAQFKAFKKKIEELKKPIDQATARAVGREVTDEMKNLMTKGVSPIEGNGRFPGYKNPKRYPGKQKPKTPVNLKLSGDFQKGLKSRPVSGKGGWETEIYYEGDEALKESGHREGVHGQPKRPTIPQASEGETFAQRIIRVISDLYRARIKDLNIK